MSAHSPSVVPVDGLYATPRGARLIVDDPAEITPAWMTEVLRAGGADAEVTALRYERVGTGQTAVSYRFHLTYADSSDTVGGSGSGSASGSGAADGAGLEAATSSGTAPTGAVAADAALAGAGPVEAGLAGAGPASVVVKLAAGDAKVRGRLRNGFRNELGYYRFFAERSLIRVPRAWLAELAPDSLTFTLVLEDAYPARPGDQLTGCTVQQALVAVRNLAGLHAPFWNSPELTPHTPWLVRLNEAGAAFLGGVATKAAAEFTERFRDRLTPADIETLRTAAEGIATWPRTTGAPVSLVHGDYRLDNLLFRDPPAGDAVAGDVVAGDVVADGTVADGTVVGEAGAGLPEVVTVDWQTLEAGFPGRDLAYFLSTALPPDERRAHERRLVAAYHERLLELGVTDYSADRCFDDYRRGMLQGPLITMIGCVYASAAPTEHSDRMFLSMAINASAALRDLDVFTLLATEPAA
ncbi:ecdysteroid 22-kinase family protein [Frankia sp. AiPa1]|uniref:ecdysteroid 22-kinase family protein n=1 Tax=Frankia sp. AiPa1 TaxID=573492 RepID=UPI00202AE43D|nr:ecdysteroid 22-kinase family protein [Frankia sp. AiPa1]MCL9762659.1 ecdysteroid 22-kinase family protein [Frankia sp. AiPa1]